MKTAKKHDPKETYYMFLVFILSVQWVWVLSDNWPRHGLFITIVTLLVADAGSYVLHYICDFYGDPEPKGLIREFQEHHRDPRHIVTKPLASILYPAAWIIVPLWAIVMTWTVAGLIPPTAALVLAVIGASWIYTNLFHRWAHTKHPSWPIRVLHATGLTLRPGPHDKHHAQPNSDNYAVMTGWTNFMLDAMHAPVMIDAIMSALRFKKRPFVLSPK